MQGRAVASPGVPVIWPADKESGGRAAAEVEASACSLLRWHATATSTGCQITRQQCMLHLTAGSTHLLCALRRTDTTPCPPAWLPQDISAQLVKTPWQEMVVLQQYCGPKGTPPSGPHGAQPFRLQVSPLALAMMDLHAHMDRWAGQGRGHTCCTPAAPAAPVWLLCRGACVSCMHAACSSLPAWCCTCKHLCPPQKLTCLAPGASPGCRQLPGPCLAHDAHCLRCAPPCRREINGLLAGSWDEEGKCLKVERALPVRELQAGPRRFAVEMCSDSVQDAFNLVEGQWKMQVGWDGGWGWGLLWRLALHRSWLDLEGRGYRWGHRCARQQL